jgi:hypothetical protein
MAWVRRASDRTRVGVAFAVGPRLLVTCAHVVNTALGRDLREASRPVQSELQLVFPFGGTGHQPLRLADVARWLPDDPQRFDLDDVALLELHEDLPRKVPSLRLAADVRHAAVQMVGPVRGRAHPVYVTGEVLGAIDESRFQVNAQLRGIFRVADGFSGGPVWYPKNRKVIGMLQAANLDVRATDVYIIGRDTIDRVYSEFTPRRAWDRLGVGATILFGAIGTLAAAGKVGWSWLAPVTGLVVAAAVAVVARLVR